MEVKKIQVILRQNSKQYLVLSKAIRNNHSIKSIHAFRVASRQLLAINPILNYADSTKSWPKKVNLWLKITGNIRNLQVLQKKFDFSARLNNLLNQKISNEIEQTQHLFQKIGGKKFRNGLVESADKSCIRIQEKPNKFIHEMLNIWAETFENLTTAIDALQADTPKTFHQLRIKYKATRYLLEFMETARLINPGLTGNLKYWQNSLGEIQDLVVAEAWLTDIPRTKKIRAKLQIQSKKLRQKFLAEISQFTLSFDEINKNVITSLNHAKKIRQEHQTLKQGVFKSS